MEAAVQWTPLIVVVLFSFDASPPVLSEFYKFSPLKDDNILTANSPSHTYHLPLYVRMPRDYASSCPT